MNRLRAAFAAAVLLLVSISAAGCTDALARSDAPPRPGDGAAPTIEQLAELMTGWQDGIVSLQMDIHTVATGADGAMVFEFRQEVWLDPRSWTIYAVTDAASFLGEEAGGLDILDIEMLLREDGIYMTPAREAGWLRISEGIDIGAMMDSIQASGFTTDILDDPRLDASLEAGSLNGRDVWVLRVAAEPELLNDPRMREAVLAGVGGLDDAEIEAAISDMIDRYAGEIVMILHIDPLTSAPLRSETSIVIDDGSGPLTIVSVSDTFGWNAPLDLPEPEPLLDEDEADAAFDAALGATGAG